MLFNLTPLIDHGELDNRTPGLVLLSLWIKGEDHPMKFSIEGDCLRDIAGCKLKFKLNTETPPNLSSFLASLPTHKKKGPHLSCITGDMTASNRVRIGKNKKDLFNALYLEWFSEEQGMFLLDSHLCELSISPPSWSMSASEEQAQIMMNQQALRDYVLDWISDYSTTPTEKDPLPDHHWDTRLREAEGTAIIYQEIHKKYGNHPLGEIAEAFVMGWDSRLGKMADSDENGTAFSCRIRGVLNIFDLLDENEAIETQLGMSHPLFQKIMTLTEYMHTTFSSRLSEDKPVSSQLDAEILSLFETIRYVTPNVLSCLLQINERDANYSHLSERMSRCSQSIEQILTTLKESNKDTSKLEKMLQEIHSETVSMQHEFAKQVNH